MINKVILIGNVGQDPEVRYTGDASNGAKVATIRLATTERYRDRNGNPQEHTEWHNVVVWRRAHSSILKEESAQDHGMTRAATRDTRQISLPTLSSFLAEDRRAMHSRVAIRARDMPSHRDISSLPSSFSSLCSRAMLLSSRHMHLSQSSSPQLRRT